MFLIIILNMKRKYYNCLDEYEDIKKKKIDYDINNIGIDVQNINIGVDTSNKYSLDNDNISDMTNETEDELVDGTTKINNQIIIDTSVLIESTDYKLEFNSLIKLFNDIINKLGKDNYIYGEYTDGEIQEIFITKYLNLMVYPSYLFQPYLFEPDIKINIKTNYIGEICNSNRNNNLNSICFDSKYLFPTWKKLYNVDSKYEFTHLTNKISKIICKNFTKKIFNFYEKVYNVYFNIIVGNFFACILSNFLLKYINPYNIKFSNQKFNDWINGFNIVMTNCKKYVFDYANELELNKIDLDDKQTLTYKLKKLKNDFIDGYENLKKINYDTIDDNIKVLFEPIKKFYNPIDSKLFVRTECMEKIDKEIEHVFKIKNYIKLMNNINLKILSSN